MESRPATPANASIRPGGSSTIDMNEPARGNREQDDSASPLPPRGQALTLPSAPRARSLLPSGVKTTETMAVCARSTCGRGVPSGQKATSIPCVVASHRPDGAKAMDPAYWCRPSAAPADRFREEPRDRTDLSPDTRVRTSARKPSGRPHRTRRRQRSPGIAGPDRAWSTPPRALRPWAISGSHGFRRWSPRGPHPGRGPDTRRRTPAPRSSEVARPSPRAIESTQLRPLT